MPAFATEPLTEVSGLLREVDSVELKVGVPEADQRAAIAALGIEPLEGHPREVVFFDTPELTFCKRGLVLRVERPQDRVVTSVVRLRPVVTEQLPVLVRNSPNFQLEHDVTGRGDVAAKSTAFLNRHGVDVGAEQHSKTTRALEFFANEFKRSDIHGTLS